MSQTHTDPATGRPYTVDPVTGQSRWLDQAPSSPPPGPSYGPGPGYPQSLHQQSAKRSSRGKKVLLWGGGIFAAIVILGALAPDGEDSTTGTAAEPSTQASAEASPRAAAKKPAAKPEPAKAAPAKIGTPVRDGKFQFTVTGTKTTKKVGDQYLGKTAQGQFLLVSVTVTNIGDEPRTFDSSAQKLFDAAGRQYAADGAAGIYLGEDAKSFLEQINPGNSVNGIIVFDIPAGASVDRIELHDSLFSGGSTVKLVK